MSEQPANFEEQFGCGVDAALGEGVAPKDAPYSQKNSHNNAPVIDAPFGVFRAGGLIKAGMAGKFPLIKADHADAAAFRKIPPEPLL